MVVTIWRQVGGRLTHSPTTGYQTELCLDSYPDKRSLHLEEVTVEVAIIDRFNVAILQCLTILVASW